MTDHRRRRQPVGPLLELSDARGWSHAYLADRVGISTRTILRWIKAGHVPAYQCDVVATRLKMHVSAIWPTFHNELDELEAAS